MTYVLVFNEQAYTDLDDLLIWTETAAGRAIADAYDARLRLAIASLEHFPHRGTPRPNLGPEFRSFTFERSRMVVYRVTDDIVEVVRILYAARDLDGTVDD